MVFTDRTCVDVDDRPIELVIIGLKCCLLVSFEIIGDKKYSPHDFSIQSFPFFK